ncbi:MAG: alpha/beta fold hydrolase, partial [Candidatus Poseidoniia archaeon]
ALGRAAKELPTEPAARSRQAFRLELEDVQFGHDSAVLLPHLDGDATPGRWVPGLAALRSCLRHAEAHPDRVLSLVLRGISLLTEAELRWWLYDIGWIQPELWREFAGHIPEDERDDLLEAYWRRLTSADKSVALDAARHWSIYEGSCCTLLPNAEFSDAFAEDELAWNLARLEAHFFRAGIPGGKALLDRIDRIRQIPAFGVHGRYDIVCPVKNLDNLSQAWPELEFQVVADAGHSSHESGITRELVAATARIARTGSPLKR